MKPTHTPLRNVRVSDELWINARQVAKSRGETVTDVIRRALENYVTRHRTPADRSSR